MAGTHTPHDEPAREESVARLVDTARPLESPSAAARARVHAAVRAEWRGKVQRNRWRRALVWAGPLAAAALLAVICVPYFFKKPVAPVNQAALGHLERAVGEVRLAEKNGASPLQSGAEVFGGQVLETADGARASFTMADGVSVRLDGGTRLTLTSAHSFDLERGAVYLDVPPGAGRGERYEVHTALGVTQDVATQFEVRLVAGPKESKLRVRVREGKVELQHGQEKLAAEAGVELSASKTGPVTKGLLIAGDSSWDWVGTVAPPFALEGKSARQFLDWACREGGWTLKLNGVGEKELSAAQVHGTLTGLGAAEALDTVLPACGLTHRFEGTTLVIEAQP